MPATSPQPLFRGRGRPSKGVKRNVILPPDIWAWIDANRVAGFGGKSGNDVILEAITAAMQTGEP